MIINQLLVINVQINRMIPKPIIPVQELLQIVLGLVKMVIKKLEGSV